jgi:hypothetical protein
MAKIPAVPQSMLMYPTQVHPELWDAYLEAVFEEDVARARGLSFRFAQDIEDVRKVRGELRRIAAYGETAKARTKARAAEIDEAQRAADENRSQLERLQERQQQLDKALSRAKEGSDEHEFLIGHLASHVNTRCRHIGALLREEFAAAGLTICPTMGYLLGDNGKARGLYRRPQ